MRETAREREAFECVYIPIVVYCIWMGIYIYSKSFSKLDRQTNVRMSKYIERERENQIVSNEIIRHTGAENIGLMVRAIYSFEAFYIYITI